MESEPALAGSSPIEPYGALFVPIGGSAFRATDYCRGPWGPDSLHGGPVVGLLARSVEQAVRAGIEQTAQAGHELFCARLTVDILGPVPLGVLVSEATVVKPGRRAVVADGRLLCNGVVVARASSQWIAQDPAAEPNAQAVPPFPESVADPRRNGDFDYPVPGFNCDAAELRYVVGSHEESGPGTTWIDLRSPLVEDECNSPFVVVATVSDLAAAAGWEDTPDGGNYINPDVTLQLARPARGRWIAVEAKVHHGGNRAAFMESILYDRLGPIGRVLQSLIEAPAALASKQESSKQQSSKQQSSRQESQLR